MTSQSESHVELNSFRISSVVGPNCRKITIGVRFWCSLIDEPCDYSSETECRDGWD